MAKKAIIIGGSNAGLMHGVMLKHHGYDVTILEQETSSTRQGLDAGIHLGPEVQRFLEKHDRVGKEFTLTCTPSVKFDVHGKPKLEHKQTMVMTNWALLWAVLRANFDGYVSTFVPDAPASLASDGAIEYRTGTRVTKVKDAGDKVEVCFEHVSSKTGGSATAALVIVADGSTSPTRNFLQPKVKRQYAGYMCWRGTVPEHLFDRETNDTYSTKFKIHMMGGHYMIMYTIPTEEGHLEPGSRLHNWVWYRNLEADSNEMNELFTDINGKKHFGVVPRGLVRPEAWEQQRAFASKVMPEGLASIVQKTPSPFLATTYDVQSPKALFFGGKLFLVGDAQVTLRPNTGMSTQHAAHDCNMLEQVVEGNMKPEDWEKTVLRWDAAQCRYSMAISAYGLRSKLSAAWNLVRWLLLLLGQRLGLA